VPWRQASRGRRLLITVPALRWRKYSSRTWWCLYGTTDNARKPNSALTFVGVNERRATFFVVACEIDDDLQTRRRACGYRPMPTIRA
jgi:hypothetical protein